MKRSFRRKLGYIVAIPLGDNYFGYARVLEDPLIAFYDFCSNEQHSPIEQIIAKTIAFKVWAFDEAIHEGQWQIIGNAPLEEPLQEPVWFYKQDMITKQLSLYRSNSNGEEIPATWEECQGLENVAVWRTIYIENRLRDHFAGRKNLTLESFLSQLNLSRNRSL